MTQPRGPTVHDCAKTGLRDYPQPAHSRSPIGAVESGGNSPKRLEEGVDKVVEIAVAFPHVLDLADRVNDCRMMLAAEAPAYLGKR